jgi:hypothetical protein
LTIGGGKNDEAKLSRNYQNILARSFRAMLEKVRRYAELSAKFHHWFGVAVHLVGGLIGCAKISVRCG